MSRSVREHVGVLLLTAFTVLLLPGQANGQTCAQLLAKVPDKSDDSAGFAFSQACAFVEAGVLDKAKQKTLAGIEANPAAEIPELLRGLLDPFAKASALLQAGLISKASEETIAAIGANPGADVPPELEALLGPFTKASALLEAGFTAKATDELTAAIAANPDTPVPEPLQTLIGPFGKARALLDAGLTSKASEELANAISANPTADVPSDLEGLLDPFAKANALNDAGLFAEAQKAVQEAIAANPGIEIPEELRPLVGDPSLWWRIRNRFVPSATMVIEVLLLVLVCLLIALTLLQGALRRWSLPRKVRKLQSLPLVWRIFRRKLLVEKFETAEVEKLDGTGLAARVEARFQQLDDERGSGLDIVRSTETPLEIPTDLAGASAPLKAITVFLDRIRISNVVKATGYLHTTNSNTSRAPSAMTMAVTDPMDELTYSQTIKVGIEPDPEHAKLADTAAAWLHHRLVVQIAREPLETEDWESYAELVAGGIALKRGAPGQAEAEAAFRRAVEADRGNLAARFNLANLRRWSADAPPDDLEDLVEKIQARTQTNSRVGGQPSYHWEALWYRAMYATTAAWLHLAQAGRDDQRNSIKCGARTATAAMSTLESAPRRKAWLTPRSVLNGAPMVRLRRQRVDSLERFLTDNEPSVLMALAGAILQAIDEEHRTNIRLRDPEEVQRRSIMERVHQLDVQVNEPNQPALEMEVLTDLASDVRSYVEGLGDRLPPRAQYNLACFYAQLGAEEPDPGLATPVDAIVVSNAARGDIEVGGRA